MGNTWLVNCAYSSVTVLRSCRVFHPGILQTVWKIPWLRGWCWCILWLLCRWSYQRVYRMYGHLRLDRHLRLFWWHHHQDLMHQRHKSLLLLFLSFKVLLLLFQLLFLFNLSLLMHPLLLLDKLSSWPQTNLYHFPLLPWWSHRCQVGWWASACAGSGWCARPCRSCWMHRSIRCTVHLMGCCSPWSRCCSGKASVLWSGGCCCNVRCFMWLTFRPCLWFFLIASRRRYQRTMRKWC